MSNARGSWKIWGLASMLGAIACSGNVLDVGDLHGAAGHAGLASAAGFGTISEGGNGNLAAHAGGGFGGSAPSSAGSSTGPSVSGSANARAGSGGSAEPGSAGGEQAGSAGGLGGPPLNCANCTLVATGDVRAVASNDQQLFWAEYGTVSNADFSHLGDGRLLVRDLDGGEPTVLATGLAGPTWIAVSSSYVYVFIDRRGLTNYLGGVLRVPIAGGSAELIQELPNSERIKQPFATTPDYEYWNANGNVYRIAHSDGATVETFAPGARSIFVDDTRLYLSSYLDNGTSALPLAGGDAEQLSAGRVDVMALAGDSLYGIESPEHGAGGGIYLSRMPKTGGDWTHISDAQTDWMHLEVSGDDYFMDEPGNDSLQLLRGSLSNPNSPRVLLASQAIQTHPLFDPLFTIDTWNCWALTRVGIFVADRSTGMYQLSLEP